MSPELAEKRTIARMGPNFDFRDGSESMKTLIS